MPVAVLPARGLVALASWLMAASLVGMVWAIGRLRAGLPLLPPARPRRVPWGVGSLLTIIALWIALSIAVGNIHRQVAVRERPVAAKAGPEPARRSQAAVRVVKLSDRDKLLLMSAINALMIPLVPLVLRRTSRATLDDLGLVPRQFGRNLARGLVGCLLLAPVCYGMMALLSKVWPPEKHPLQEMIQTGLTPEIALLAVVSAVVLAPVTEELLFRGVLLPWLTRLFDPSSVLPNGPLVARAGPLPGLDEGAIGGPGGAGQWTRSPQPGSADLLFRMPDPCKGPLSRLPLAWAWPNVLASAVFAGLHAPQWPAPLSLFPLALGLGWLYRRTGSLWAPIALHACFNGLSTALLFLTVLAAPKDPAEGLPVPPPARAPSLRPGQAVRGTFPRISDSNSRENVLGGGAVGDYDY